jgi:hypothetical protein
MRDNQVMKYKGNICDMHKYKLNFFKGNDLRTKHLHITSESHT